MDQVGSSVPRWDHHLTLTYSNSPFTATLTGRLISAGVLDPTYIVCPANCPAQTSTQALNNPTVNDAHQPGAFLSRLFPDLQLCERGRRGPPGLLQCPEPAQQGSADRARGPGRLVPYFSVQTNPMLYDVLGRTFRLGFRLNL